MDRLAVLIDAGYLLSQSVQILSRQQSKSRKDIVISDPQGLIGKIVEHSIDALGNRKLLRVYWYDGVLGKLSTEQEALSQLADVQFRAGTIRSGQQKGVDSKIMADLIELSGNHAISDAVLVTGDGDLVVGIDLAQRRGVRIAALGIEDIDSGVPHNQSFEVICAADRVKRIGKAEIGSYLSYSPAVALPPAAVPSTTVQAPVAKKPPPKKAPGPDKAITGAGISAPAAKPVPPPADLSDIVKKFIAAANPPFDKKWVTTNGIVPPLVDGKLLKAVTEALGRTPMLRERAELRRLFREHLLQERRTDL